MNVTLYYLVAIGIFIAMTYFLIYLPDKKKRKKYDSMVNELKLNDEIMTRGGVIGKVISIDDESFVLESGPNKTRIRFSKKALASVYTKNEVADKETEKKK